jgi:hypothetical protein
MQTRAAQECRDGLLARHRVHRRNVKLEEPKNGRLATMAFGGAVTQAGLTSNSFPRLYADRSLRRKGPGQASSVRRGKVAMCAEGGYKMSMAVLLLPASPALKGYVGEEDGLGSMGTSLPLTSPGSMRLS